MSKIQISTNSVSRNPKPFPQTWKTLCTAGRAGEGLRSDWRSQLEELLQSCAFQYLRFHGLFHDDMMVYREQNNQPIFNWMYIDELFDYLLKVRVKPFVELGFMPEALKSGDATCFWWKGNITPPKLMDRWQLLVQEFINHCINRYGIEEVRTWYFEVWNEPNLFEFFWHGTQEEYFSLYKATVTTIKDIDPALRVGGPSSSNFAHGEAPWVRDFLAFCKAEQLPVDFVSFHPYPNKWPTNEEGQRVLVYRGPESLKKDLLWIKQILPEYGFPDAEVHITEWNSSFSNRDLVHDTMFMGPFILHNVAQSLDLTHSLGFWTFTDIFEETRVGDTSFHGGFGLITTEGMKKPSYWAYWYLNRLGKILIDKGPSWICTSNGNQVQILTWNYAHYNSTFSQGNKSELTQHNRYSIFEDTGLAHYEFGIELPDSIQAKQITTWEMNREAGSVFDEWQRIGAPTILSKDVLQYLKNFSGPAPKVYSNVLTSANCDISLSVPPHGIVLVTIDLNRSLI